MIVKVKLFTTPRRAQCSAVIHDEQRSVVFGLPVPSHVRIAMGARVTAYFNAHPCPSPDRLQFQEMVEDQPW